MSNREYKDRLFIFLFGKEERKEMTLSLINAINNTKYKNLDNLTFNTINEVVYGGMKNDISFIILPMLHLIEHQSSYTPNMPIRFLLYMSKIIEKIITSNNISVYANSKIEIPRPQFIMLYNGSRQLANSVEEMKLSDLYEGKGEINLELIVKAVDINFSDSNEILHRCKALYEYSWLVERIRKYEVKMELDMAIDKALDDMPEEFIIKELLMENKAEVKGMLLTEWDWEKEKIKLANTERNAGIKEGIKKGRIEGRNEGIKQGISEGENNAYKDVYDLLEKYDSFDELKKIIESRISHK